MITVIKCLLGAAIFIGVYGVCHKAAMEGTVADEKGT